jgi:hypothetical protein
MFNLSKKGKDFIKIPKRNQSGRIVNGYYTDLILIFIIQKSQYTPSTFKDYVYNLGILSEHDCEYMNTRNYYPVWKHNIDAAKQQLFDKKYIIEVEKYIYIINKNKIKEIKDMVMDYFENNEAII